MRSVGVLLVMGIAGASWPAWRFARGYRAELKVLDPPTGVVPLPSDAQSLGLTPVTIMAGATRLGAWYAPPRGGGTIVLCHGSNATRESLLAEARALIAAGHGVVMFDWPGHGESGGALDLGDGSRAALRAVLEFARHAPGVDSTRIGVYTFSLGGVFATPVVAADKHVRAIALAGAPVDLVAQTRYEYAKQGRLTAEGALWFWRHRGVALDTLGIRDYLPMLAPRPVLAIVGDSDRTVSPRDASTIVQAVGASAELWRVARAGHGDYATADSTYGTRLAAFFTRTLAPMEPPLE